MPDLLSHAFIAFTICTLLSLRYDWLSGEYVTVGMAGAFIPDMAKIKLLVDAATVEATLDIPFDWLGVHTLGGALVAVLVGVVVVNRSDRRRVFGLLSLGATSHLFADALLLKASGRSYEVLWPLTQYHPPTPGLYLSTDIWLTGVTGSVAVAAYLFVQYRA
ncbi:metal-dependent hydrolase [Haloarcula hispanica N601]|uniref:Metal-dependent hydrolase n=3 Tax=Haloarcula hispanica TaxID=51589 RepID=A0A482T8I1_HALHI|nr:MULTISPECIES: metal-dependent hydrolase [Haloarcula]AEM56984.1 putative membrane-bound metal-dependent hydrolase [Haloarcula hispanica ATCC 33960]AHB65774.1 metal-dependent hydrolase [Haloarcula hispanica N601]AJF26916.1 metal-dependent hydrolase [Haloarcula sp. CBA1115]KAA9407285.1 metal-dependent hydrolase [Haloarcula sp. CBA1131]KAA9409677.1 metal-dependent hydrolase [Haloarcula hispanica]